ncbi:DNA polymerase subunit beta, partial [Candidatus Bathyarchaeota archaeon]
PAKYLVEKVKVLEGPKDVDLREVASYEGVYADIAREGDVIEARGKIEVVEDKLTGETYHRLLVGTLEGGGRDYIKRLT